jgi:hypothetical protein
MTVRTPVYFDGANIVDMTTDHITQWKTYIAYLYSTAPTVTVTVVSSSGTLSPDMSDTRLQAGAATVSQTSAYAAEAATAEPSTVTVAYDKITGPTYDTSLGAQADTSNIAFPAYRDGNNIKAMSLTDYVDTFIYATLDAMITAGESATTNGTYTIATAATVTNYTEIKIGDTSTPVFIDTRADTTAYSAAGIPETLDQPATITSYYLQRANFGRTFPTVAPLLIDADGNLNQVDLTSDTSAFNAILKNDIRFYAAEDTGGHKLSYNINGSGNSRGTAIVDTRLNGAGNYQTLLATADDYRSQEFPDGTAATISTYTFKIVHV